MSAPLLSLREASLSFGGRPLFQDLSVHLSQGDKTCLVGRNGCGKSTLLKLLAGLLESDKGERFLQPGVTLEYLPQDGDLPADQTILDFVQQTPPLVIPAKAGIQEISGSRIARFSNIRPSGLTQENLTSGMTGGEVQKVQKFQAEALVNRLDLDPSRVMANLSGGERRRVSLAKTLVAEPDILLLDEPTNHLDLATIQWLEGYLRDFKGALIVISHDRTFLETVSTSTLWLDRGILRHHQKGFGDFENWSDQILEEEEKHLDRLDNRLRLETEWLHRGVTARRKRNQGRLSQLMDLRQQKRDRLNNQVGKSKSVALDGNWGSRLVIEAKEVTKAIGGRLLINKFSARILRGERIGIIGPNGAGKTTLLRVLLGLTPPDEGHVRLGKNIEPIYFDQLRSKLDPRLTLWETLCPQGGDQVWVQGKPRHVFGYLKDFLFEEKQIRGVVSILSGGEKNRLCLAQALARPGNLLVLDEPTNDLDMDTLDLLIDMLSSFEGTLLVVSHDRDFLDKLTTSIIAVEGDGTLGEYIGGYQDYLRQRPPLKSKTQTANKSSSPDKGEKPQPKRFSYNQKREWEQLPTLIQQLNQQIEDLENQLADPDLIDKPHHEISLISQQLEEKQQLLDQAETRWLELSELVDNV